VRACQTSRASFEQEHEKLSTAAGTTVLPLLRNGSSPLLVNVSSEAGSIGPSGRDREFDYCMGGSHAALDPQAVAEIVTDRLLGQKPLPSGCLFIDHQGNPLPW
jgi:hypothetical protein